MQPSHEHETRLLKVSINHPYQVAAIVGVLFGIGVALYLALNHRFAEAKLVAVSMSLMGLGLFLVTWGWVAATATDITARNLFYSSTVQWNSITKIETISWLGMLILRTDDTRVDLIPAGWAGKDKDQLLDLLESKLRGTGLEPKEYNRFP